MNILGLIEMHPFDGTEAFICLRIQNNHGVLFDLPITPDQLDIVASNSEPSAPKQEPDEQSYEPAAENMFSAANTEDDTLVIEPSHYTMGQSSPQDEDYDL